MYTQPSISPDTRMRYVERTLECRNTLLSVYIRIDLFYKDILLDSPDQVYFGSVSDVLVSIHPENGDNVSEMNF
jgi:hypothetical protein